MLKTAITDKVLIRKKILETCFEFYETPITLAAKQPANNKLDLERLEHDSRLRELIVPAIGALAAQYDPEFIVGVPNGATWLSDAVASQLNCYSVHLKRDKDRVMSYENQQLDEEMLANPLSRGVMVEDVFNRFTNTRRALAVPGLAPKIAAVIGIWDRGAGHAERQAPTQPYQALISEHIAEMLPYET